MIARAVDLPVQDNGAGIALVALLARLPRPSYRPRAAWAPRARDELPVRPRKGAGLILTRDERRATLRDNIQVLIARFRVVSPADGRRRRIDPGCGKANPVIRFLSPAALLRAMWINLTRSVSPSAEPNAPV